VNVSQLVPTQFQFIRYFLLIATMLFCHPGMAVQLLAGQGETAFDRGELSLLRDPGGKFNLDQVRELDRSGAFRPLTGNLGLGYTSDAAWLRLSLQKGLDAPADWLLQARPAYLDDVRLYIPDGKGGYQEQRAGDMLPVDARATPSLNPAFSFGLAAGENVLYLRIRTTSTLAALVSIWPQQTHMSPPYGEYLFYGLYFGILLAVLLFNLINWIFLRRAIFGLYSLYLALTTCFSLAASGLLGLLILPTAPQIANASVGVLVGMSVAAAYPFYDRLLKLKRHFPRLHVLLWLASGYAFLTGLSAFTVHYGRFAPWLMVLILIINLLLLWPAWRYLRSRRHDETLIALGYFIYSASVFLNMSAVLGLIPIHWWTLNGVQVGNVAHILLLHFGLAASVRRTEYQRQLAIKKSLAAERDAEQARRARDDQAQFLSMMAHEIRTPLSVINAAAETLRILDTAPAPEREQRYQRIQRAVTRMSTMLEIGLARERMDETGDHTRMEVLNLRDVTHDAIAQAEAGNRASVAAETAPPVIGDSILIRLLFLNLIDNALKYSPEESPISIRIEPGAQAGQEGVLWSITDTGPCVPAGEEERIFEKYHRASENLSKPGMGLGLHLARQIVEKHGGWLRYSPDAQGRCRFVCWLPA
jgi:signal transduction histidine kinase